MSLITLRYQAVVFGSYDDITPTLENIRFFLTDFSDRNFIPSQVRETGYDWETGTAGPGIPRLNLSTTDEAWAVRFESERIDFMFTNIDIGVTELPGIDRFVREVHELLAKISTRFNKTHKRLGLVAHYAYENTDPTALSKKFLVPVPFFRDKATADWTSRQAVRMGITEPLAEPVNVTSDTKWIRSPLLVNGKPFDFSGLQIKIDVNTLFENFEYRITAGNAPRLLEVFKDILVDVEEQTSQTLEA